MLKEVAAGVLRVAYQETGRPNGTPVLLLHGFPYDVHAYDAVTPLLVSAGCRVITPYLRGYGPTRFLSPETQRSGQQAVLAHDLLALLDALAIPRAVLAGYDWGGRAACIVAALWPEPGPRTRVGRRLRLQHSGHRGSDEAAGTRGRVSVLVPILLSDRARPRRPRHKIATRCASSSGSSGRPTGASMTRPTNRPPRPSTTPTLSMSSSTRTGTATGSWPEIRRSRTSSASWRPSRESRCPPSRSMARPTGCSRRAGPSSRTGIFPRHTSTA